MLLIKLKTYLQKKKVAQLNEIASYLNVQPSVAKSLIMHWIKKGRIQEKKIAQCDSACPSCHCEQYCWIE